MIEPAVEQATNIAEILWRSIPSEYKRRYAQNIWEQFQAGLKASAYTSALNRFVSNFERRFGALAGATPEDRAALDQVLNEARIHERAVLRAIRDQAAYVVLRVRIANDARRAVYQVKIGEVTNENL